MENHSELTDYVEYLGGQHYIGKRLGIELESANYSPCPFVIIILVVQIFNVPLRRGKVGGS